MERYKITTTVETEDLDTKKISTTEKTVFEIVKSWDELTREEKQKEIESHSEGIYQCYQDDLYENYKLEIENIREKYKNIDFEDIYFDSSSHGSWIDNIKKFKYYGGVDIFGERVEVYDVDFHIRKYIQEISSDELYIDMGYYVDAATEEKIKRTKKYQNFVNDVIKEINSWIDDVNNAAKEMLEKEYYYPYDLDDADDADWLQGYFEFMNFTFTSEEEL